MRTPSGRRLTAFLESVPADLDHTVIEVPATMAGGQRAAQEIIASASGIDGVFAYNDVMAIGAMRELRAGGVSIPDDIAVIGCDDVQIAAVTTPSLTSIRIDRERLGRTAVETLTALVAGGDATPSVRVLPVEIIGRESA